MKFKEGNTSGKGRPKGTKNKVDKEALIDLVNLCVTDLNTRFDTLNTYQKIKILTAFKDVYRDALTEIQNQSENRIFEVIIHGNNE